MTDAPPEPDVRTYSQLVDEDFRGGQAHILKLRNLIKTIFDGATSAAQTWKTTYGQRSLSSKDRASEEVHAREFTGYDAGGLVATNHTAINSAWAAMIERGRSRVVLGPGSFRLGAALTLEKTFVDGSRCELIGAGAGVTNITGPTSTTNIINIGNDASAQTGNIGIRDLQISPGATQTGYAIAVHHSRDVLLERLNFHLVANGFGIGTLAASTATKCQGITMRNCHGKTKVNAGGSWLHIVAGDFITLEGGRTSGRSDQYFLHHSGTISSADGVYILGHQSEQWGQAIRSTGPGLVNFHFDCEQFDRAVNFIYVISSETSSNRDWQVRCQLLGEATTATAADAAIHMDASAGGDIEGITIYGSAFDARKGPVGRFIGDAVDDRGPYVLFIGNTIRDCGNTGVPLFEIGANTNPQFFGTMITQGIRGGATPYTIAFNFAGASTGRRKTEAEIIANNTILDFSDTEVAGTP